MFWQKLTYSLAKNDWIKMREYEDMPLTEFLNAISFHLYLQKKRAKKLDGVKTNEAAIRIMLGDIFDR